MDFVGLETQIECGSYSDAGTLVERCGAVGNGNREYGLKPGHPTQITYKSLKHGCQAERTYTFETRNRHGTQLNFTKGKMRNDNTGIQITVSVSLTMLVDLIISLPPKS
jgi:hypothetical protein